ncbi:hypothetical protein [Cupriavidus necator]|uniref:hypothetical protein n=1 Tax=Cupriavidus necator TaxID=106590 RepID=UPI00339D93A5
MNELFLRVVEAGELPQSLGFSADSLPALITLGVRSASAEEHQILSIRWDAMELVRWFLANKEEILTRKLPEYVPRSSSIAESISLFYENLGDDQDDLVDDIFEYRECHEICFGLRGSRSVPAIYVGLGHCGYEVSIEHPDQYVKFLIDLPDFYLHLERAFKERL